MFKNLLIVTFSFFLLACSGDDEKKELASEELKLALIDLENDIKQNKISIGGDMRFPTSVATPYNDFDYVGENYLVFLEDLKLFVENNEPTRSEIEDFINNQAQYFPELNIDIEPDIFRIVGESAGNSLNIVASDNSEYGFVETLKIYEDFVQNNVEQSTESYQNLMVSFAFYKWLGYQYMDDEYQGGRAACGHRDCFDCCMYTAFKNYNWSETILFLISPGVTAGSQAISCIEDCYLTNE